MFLPFLAHQENYSNMQLLLNDCFDRQILVLKAEMEHSSGSNNYDAKNWAIGWN